jgi:hypothetical protein
MALLRSKVLLGTVAGAALIFTVSAFVKTGQPVDEGSLSEPVLYSDETDEELYTETLSDMVNFRFLLRELDGRIAVFDVYSEEFLFDTGIFLLSLPNELIDDITSGLYLTDETELYDFIENYSS